MLSDNLSSLHKTDFIELHIKLVQNVYCNICSRDRGIELKKGLWDGSMHYLKQKLCS